jgi:hypothetical protein
MTWTKTADDYPDRLLELSDSAYRLHHATTTLCNRLGLDGRITKARLALVPVPQRTRRPAVVRELVAAELWCDDGSAWRLVDFFDAQPSAEEMTRQREYDAARQRKRFARTIESRQLCDASIDAARTALFDARERRRARASQRESHADSQRPAPTRPVPTRNNEVEDEVPEGLCALCHLEIGADAPISTYRGRPAHAPWDGACRPVAVAS